MTAIKRVKSGLDMLFRSLLVLELFWIVWLAVMKSPLTLQWSLMIVLGSLLGVPLINRLQRKWPPVYQLFALLLLFSGIWSLSGFSISLAGFLILIGVLGSIPQESYSRLMVFCPLALYTMGYFQNSTQQRLLALLMVVVILVILLLQAYLKETAAALDLSKALDGTSQGSFLLISRQQLRLLVTTVTTLGSLLLGLMAWLQPFGTFVSRQKEVTPLEQTAASNSGQVFQPQPGGFDTDQLAAGHKPNQLLLQVWAFLETGMKLILLIAVVLILLFTLYRMLRYLKMKQPVIQEEDPPAEADFILLDKKKTKRPSPFLPRGDYNQRVRRLFKQEVGKQFHKDATPRQLLALLPLPVDYAHQLARLYEKARYDQQTVSKDEWTQLKALANQR